MSIELIKMLNSINLVYMSALWTYVVVYFLLWFFKMPYHKKMALKKNSVIEIYLYFALVCGGFSTMMEWLTASNGKPFPLGFCVNVMLMVVVFLVTLPETIEALRKRIPERD